MTGLPWQIKVTFLKCPQSGQGGFHWIVWSAKVAILLVHPIQLHHFHLKSTGHVTACHTCRHKCKTIFEFRWCFFFWYTSIQIHLKNPLGGGKRQNLLVILKTFFRIELFPMKFELSWKRSSCLSQEGPNSFQCLMTGFLPDAKCLTYMSLGTNPSLRYTATLIPEIGAAPFLRSYFLLEFKWAIHPDSRASFAAAVMEIISIMIQALNQWNTK